MKDAYYFSHDSNAKDDPKCMMLIEQLGLEGYGIFWVLVETLRDQPNYKYPLSLLPAIARRYNTTFEKVKTVVLNYNLFYIENDEFFFSKSLNERMQAANFSRISGIKGSLKRYGYLDDGELKKMSDSQILDFHLLVTNKQVSPLHSPLHGPLLAEKERKGNKNKRKENKFDFKKSVIDLGVDEQIISDWLIVRAKKKASNTLTSYNRLVKQIQLSGLTANECIKIAAEKSWKEFEAEWIKKDIPRIDFDPSRKKL